MKSQMAPTRSSTKSHLPIPHFYSDFIPSLHYKLSLYNRRTFFFEYENIFFLNYFRWWYMNLKEYNCYIRLFYNISVRLEKWKRKYLFSNLFWLKLIVFEIVIVFESIKQLYAFGTLKKYSFCRFLSAIFSECFSGKNETIFLNR